MKRIYILIPIVIASLSVAFTACDESEFLKEDALSFYSQDNSFVNTADFERSVTAMYSQGEPLGRYLWRFSLFRQY